MTQSKKNIGIISIYSFPIGMAATNRILAYSKGLIENNANVNVYIPFPIESIGTQYEFIDKGVYNGISYWYTIGRNKNRFKLLRAISILSGFRKIFGFIATCWKIIRHNKKRKFDALIISNDEILTLFVYSIFLKIIKVPSLFIFDEYPIPIRHKLKDKIPDWKRFLYGIVLRNMKGYVSISEELKFYYNSICIKPTLVLPILIDTSRFNDISSPTFKKENKRQYLCYMGNMEISKDNVDLIIKSFEKIHKNFPEIDLHLYGQPSEDTFQRLKKIIKLYNIEDRVFLMGKISSNFVPDILMNAKILVSSQPDTLRASGGFPTKLGEYLASGIPVLLSDVGENSKYFNDMEHLFFVKPNDVIDYSLKLRYILDNYEKACEIAKNGKNYLNKNYSHPATGKIFIEFIQTIKK